MLPGEYTFVPPQAGPLNAPYLPSSQVTGVLRPVSSRTRIGGFPGVSSWRVARNRCRNETAPAINRGRRFGGRLGVSGHASILVDLRSALTSERLDRQSALTSET